MYNNFLVSVYYNKIDINFFDFLFGENVGAIYSFIGVVRVTNNNKKVESITYNFFEDFFYSILTNECILFLKNGGLKICIAQRYGKLNVGDINLLVGVSARHRKEAFLFCSELVEFIKHHVPVWKKEFYCDGTYKWINT